MARLYAVFGYCLIKFLRPTNKLATYAIEEAFLAQHLGGRFEPIQNDFKDSSLQIKEGKQFISTLAENPNTNKADHLK